MTLSCLIIVQNEEKYIKKALENIIDYVDEIVVVDGGSKDKTISILKEFNCKILHRKFDFNFELQRNYGIEHCTGEWIITLDADEYFSEDFLKKIHLLVRQKEYDAFYVRRYNSYLEQIKNPFYRWYKLKKQGYEYQIKLFKSYCRYKGRLHETIIGYKSIGKINELIIHNKSMERQKYNNEVYKLMRRNKYEKPSKKNLNHKKREVIDLDK